MQTVGLNNANIYPCYLRNPQGAIQFRILIAPIFFIMSNTIVINRSTIKTVSTEISEDLIFNRDLSMQEKGLLIFIIAMPEDSILSKNYLYENLPDSKYTIDKTFTSLIDKGFIKSNKIKDTKGQFRGFYYVVSQLPFLNNY